VLVETTYVRIHLPSGLRSKTRSGADAGQPAPAETTEMATAAPLGSPISSPRSQYQSTSPGRSIAPMKSWPTGHGTGSAADRASLASGATATAGVVETGPSLAGDGAAAAAVPAAVKISAASVRAATRPPVIRYRIGSQYASSRDTATACLPFLESPFERGTRQTLTDNLRHGQRGKAKRRRAAQRCLTQRSHGSVCAARSYVPRSRRAIAGSEARCSAAPSPTSQIARRPGPRA
jgi:hypothetical protein